MSYTLRIFVVVFLVVQVEVLGSVFPAPRVSTNQGHFTGIRQRLPCGENCTKTIYKFLGIRYAQRPRRFRRSRVITASTRSAQHDATRYQQPCVQFNGFASRGSEDCLFLNIYTPFINGSRKYPVMVFIHGGRFIVGSPSLDTDAPGEYLPIRDVVLVTIQYRLGPFGFFMVRNSQRQAPGNMGLLDQVEALKWIRNNIDNFGGDKNSVTIFGESAGGNSVGYHYVSRRSRSLFHRGIAVSGVDLEVAPIIFKPKSVVRRASIRLLKKLGCDKNRTVDQKVRCLRRKSLMQIVLQSDSLKELLMPTVDNHFLYDSPRNLRKRGIFKRAPLMAGFTSKDGLVFLRKMLRKKGINLASIDNDRRFTSALEVILEKFIKNRPAKKAWNDLISAFKANYGLLSQNLDTQHFYKALVNIATDFLFAAPAHDALTFHSNHSATAYLFEFNHPLDRANHGASKEYEFGKPLLQPQYYDDDARNVSDIMVTMFTNFAKFGNPTPNPVHGVQWQPFTFSNKAFLRIQRNPVMASNHRYQGMKLLNGRGFIRLMGSTKRSQFPEPIIS